MPVLTKDRQADMKMVGRSISVPVKAGVTIYKGAGVCMDASGAAVPASDTTGLITVGLADEHVTGGANDGDVYIRVKKGVAEFNNGSTPPTAADIGRVVYWENDNQVTPTVGNGVKAGTVDSIEDGKSFVKIFDETA